MRKRAPPVLPAHPALPALPGRTCHKRVAANLVSLASAIPTLERDHPLDSPLDSPLIALSAACPNRWKSSWRKGMVNGKPIGKDPSPAIRDISNGVPPPTPTPIEISDTTTGALLYTGEVNDGALSKGPEAEEAADLAAAIQASLASAPTAAKNPAPEVAAGPAAAGPAKEAAPSEPSQTQAPAVVATDEAPDEIPAALPAAPAAAGASAPSAPSVRVPYRASMLTRVLRNCFEDDTHRTAIVAAVAPGAESVIHSLNTLDHVLLMAPHLRHASCEVDVPMIGAGSAAGGGAYSYEDTPVHEWTAEQVIEWLSTAEGGRFAQVVVPKGTEGKVCRTLP